MTSLNIQTNVELEVLENIKSLLLSIDPNTIVSYKDDKDDYYISDEDAKKLDKACEEIENGQAQYLSFDEVKKLSSENLRKLGADI